MTKTKASKVKYILHTICSEWTGCTWRTEFVTLKGKWEWWRWTLVMFSTQFGVHKLLYITANLLPTNTAIQWSSPQLPLWQHFPFLRITLITQQVIKCKCLLILQDPNAQIGQRNGFSEKDIERVVRMYGNSGDTSSHATQLQFTALIIITLNICTLFQ